MTGRARARAALAIAAVALGAVPAVARAEVATPRRLIYAAYESEEAAAEAFKALKDAEASGRIKIESYAVVTKTVEGKVKIKDQREKGARTGAIVGALVSMLGGPMGAAIGVAAASGTGYLAGDAVGMPREMIDAIKFSLQPGESAVIAVVDEKWAAETERLQGAGATRLLSHELPLATKDARAPGARAPDRTAPRRPE
jgi:uncharacterized membrane protein